MEPKIDNKMALLFLVPEHLALRFHCGMSLWRCSIQWYYKSYFSKAFAGIFPIQKILLVIAKMDSIIKSWLESDLELTVCGSIGRNAKSEKIKLKIIFPARGIIHSDGKFI